MRLEKSELYEIADKIADDLGADTLLEELLRALDDIQLAEALEYIDQVHELDLFPG